MPEDTDLAENLPDGEEGRKEYSRAAARARKEQEARVKLEGELAELKASQRAAELKAKLPAGIDPSIYPADAPTDENSVQAFLKDKLGMSPEANEAWRRYDAVSGQSEPPAPPRDEDEVWAETEMAKTAAFYQRQNAPTPKELEDMHELKTKVFGKLNEWDQRVSEGRMDVLIDPGGFGGLTDPPPWARRARHHIVSSQ